MENFGTITALERIRRLQQKGVGGTVLDLSSLELTYIPPEIEVLRHLKELYLQNNQLTALPSEIGNLSQLQVINAAHNSISQITKAVRKLSNLNRLDLSHNKLNSLPFEFAQLKHLHQLDLSHNNFTDIPKALKQLPNLNQLIFNHNRINRLPHTIAQMTELVELHLESNEIDKLPDTIGQLQFLRVLNLGRNTLTTLPSSMGQLLLLQELSIPGNWLTSLPAEIGQLRELRHLNLASNRLSNIPLQIASLVRLTNTTDHPGLDLHDNRFNVPDEIFQREPAEIIQYLTDLQLSKNTKPLHEAKIIFIGSGEVGKTSLINMLTSGTYNTAEPITDGIQIKDWEVKRGTDHIKLHVWDFGGQEILHATHKFFMTGRTVYVLVINPRTEDRYGDSELEYWLKLIRSFAGVSVPIVVVINKCETHKIDLAKGTMQDKYANIVAFVETSCKDNKNIDQLEAAITNAVSKLKHIDDLLPKSYFEIKQQLEQSNDNYITYEGYRQICNRVNPDFTEPSMETLVNLLHDLGVMLYISDDRRLKDTQVLNPEWVTKGVYQIIASPKLIGKKGIIKAPEIRNILDPNSYPTDKERYYIMDIMQHFELCYQISSTDDSYFIPGAFTKDRPPFEWEFTPNQLLRFQYHYEVLPASIMSLFIVRVHDFIRKHDYWRNGVVISKDGCEVLIKADPQERKVYIEVSGSGNKRDILSFIRAQFDVLHKRFSGIKVNKFIVYEHTTQSIPIDLDKLLLHEEMNESHIVIPELKTKLSVKLLLSGIQPEQVSVNRGEVYDQNHDYQRREGTFSDRGNTKQLEASKESKKLTRVLKYIGGGIVGIIGVLAGLSEVVGEPIINFIKQLWAK